MSEFLSMGGYGAFVWPCFGMAAFVLVGLYVASSRQLKKLQAQDEQS